MDGVVEPVSEDVFPPVFNRAAQVGGVVVGLLTLVAAAVAVFQTENEVGSAALVTAGAVLTALSMFGNHVRTFEAAGLRLDLVRQATNIRHQAEQARASGEMEKADELESRAQSLLATASAIGSRYEDLRTSEPPGWSRTSRMEQVLRDARAIDTSGLAPSHVEGIFRTEREGNRIFALALIEDNPGLASAGLLVEAIVHSRSSFEQYHALVAAEHALDHLTTGGRAQVRGAVETVLAGPLGVKSSDRRTMAHRILERTA